MLGLTLTGGFAGSENGGGILNDHTILMIDSCAVQNSGDFNRGGGIYNDGSGGSAALTILNSTVSENSASLAGGGIYNNADNGGSATLTITNSTIDGNTAAYDDIPVGGGEGGGIYNSGSIMTISDSSVSYNSAGLDGPNFPTGIGGGISNYGTLTITNSSINGNGALLAGGGVYNKGTLTIANSTVTANGSTGQHDGQPLGHGGGILGEVTLTNSTLSDNFASLPAGGIDGYGAIGNTILNNNSGANLTGNMTSLGYNLSSDNGSGRLTGPGDQINTDPMIGPLQDNGGPTLTHALLPGSPAIDAGDPRFTPPPNYDQRGPGFRRVRNRRVDIGSFEVQAGQTPRPRPTSPPRPTPH
jgi:hypothetical protein